ncbi:hypothetical protein GOP47_0001900 [Adiantum capillus-veneris]|uniref:Cyclin-like domain-containing protein n=1 Tax=Adiantum capillus-veneris TaxID=13818 RepID=A0A9D4V9P6_ADICA|nr:hypothetical protein GOP47_0001900 [Adiantum capillus-veneris]
MDLLCEEEINWSPKCLPHIDDESDLDQSSSISSPPLAISSNSSIDCLSNSNFSIDSFTIHQCSDTSCIDCHHQCNSTACCNSTTSSCDFPSPDFHAAASHFLPTFDEQELQLMLEKQFEYMPEKYYYEELRRKNLSLVRRRAVQWLVGAQSKFSFTYTTIALAINYFDRYLSKNLSKVWSNWMLELLSTACLSIAAKMDEVVVPSILDLQQGAKKHIFHPSTVERMELLLLSTLQWKMRVSKLLFGVLLDSDSLQFDPCTLAASSIFYALGEIAPHILQFRPLQVPRQLLTINEDDFQRCCELIKEHGFPWASKSPLTKALYGSNKPQGWALDEHNQSRCDPSPTNIVAVVDKGSMVEVRCGSRKQNIGYWTSADKGEVRGCESRLCTKAEGDTGHDNAVQAMEIHGAEGGEYPLGLAKEKLLGGGVEGTAARAAQRPAGSATQKRQKGTFFFCCLPERDGERQTQSARFLVMCKALPMCRTGQHGSQGRKALKVKADGESRETRGGLVRAVVARE